MGSDHGETCLEHAVQIRFVVLDVGYGRRSRVHRRSRRPILRAERANRRKAVEFSDRSRTSRSRDLVFGERKTIHSGNERMASNDRRRGGRRTVPERELPAGLDACRVRSTGGIEMKAILLLLFVPAFAAA